MKSYIVYSLIMESLLMLKGNLWLKNICAYHIYFYCICDFSCKYCHQSKAKFSEMAELPAEEMTRATKRKQLLVLKI